MSNSMRPHRRQPTRLPRPWDSPGKNTAVGCHFLLQCMKVKSESEVTQSCPTLCYPMDCSLPGSSIHGIFQARVSYPSINPFVNAFRACTEFSHSSLALQPTLWLASPHFSPVAVTKSCPTVRDLMDCSMPGFPIPHLHFSPASLQISPNRVLASTFGFR